VKDGETIDSAPPLVLADLFKKTSGILDSSQKAIDNATLATAHLNSVSAKIDSGRERGSARERQAALCQSGTDHDHLQSTMVQAQTGVTDFQENMEALKHNFF